MKTFFRTIFAAVTIFMLSPLISVSANCTMETERVNKALAKRFYEKVWFSDNPEVVDEIFAPEYVVHDIGDRKGIIEVAEEQKIIAGFFWNNGTLSGNIDYQISDCDMVVTRWHGKFVPETWWMKLLGVSFDIPIINVFRFEDGKIVEIWNHRHDIDSFQGTFEFIKGLAIGSVPGIVLLFAILLRLWRKRKPASV